MKKQETVKIFNELTHELVKTTEEKDKYELDYELEKARLLFSEAVASFSNQTMRDAQLDLLLDEKGMYRTMAELRTKARIAWYKWSSVKSLIDGNTAEKE